MKKIIALVLSLIVGTLYGSEDGKGGSVEGTVLEKSTRQPLPGATVMITGTKYGTATDVFGKFQISDIPAGMYQIEVTMIGFEKQIKSEIVISVNRVITVLFELTPVSIDLNKTISVSAGYFETDPEKTVSTRKLTPHEIKSSPGSAEDVFRVVHTIPGVTTGGMSQSNLIVRGGAPDENLALLDNIEIYSPLHFGKLDASMGTISIINPDLLESVEFSSGGFPAEFGGKLSSLFELKLKEGNKSSFNSDINLNLAGFGVYTDGPISEKSNLIFSVRRGIFDLITKMMGKDLMPRFWDAVSKITYNLGSSHKISLIGFYYEDNNEKEKLDLTGHSPDSRKYEYVKYDAYGSAVGINWNFLFSNNGYSLTTASFTTNGWNMNSGTILEKSLNGKDLLEQEFTLKNESVIKLNNFLELKGGLFAKSVNSNHYTWNDADTTRTGIIFPRDTSYYYPPISFKSGGFIQTTIRPFTGLIFTTGLRYDYFDLTHEGIVSPRFSLNWKPVERVSINAAYSKISQDPAAYQMLLDEENKKLKSAKADQFILGIDYLFREDIKLSIEGYYKNLTNTFVSSSSSDIITNAGSGYISGIELFFQKKMIDNLVGSLSYSYSISRRKDGENLPEYNFDYDRTHNFNLVASYKISDTWQLGIKYTYGTGTPYTPVDGITKIGGNHFLVEGLKNSSRYPAYHEMDVRIDKKFFFNNWTLNVYLDIWNVYNHGNVIQYENEIQINGSVNQIPIYDFKMMPILGISAQL